MNQTGYTKAKMWCFALLLFAFHFLFQPKLFAETNGTWQKIFTKSGECHISFPCTPQVVQQSLPTPDGEAQLSYDVYIAPHEDKGVFLLLVATYPAPVSAGHELAGLDGLLQGIVSHHPQNQLVFADVVDVEGYPAMNFLIEGGNNYFRGQALIIGNKLYLIAMEGLKDMQDEPVFTKFLKSFKIKGLLQ